MSYLEWNLDVEDGIDIVDPVGDICIIGDEGMLMEKYTYLDAFFEVLIYTVHSIKANKNVVVDPVVEPNDICFNFQENVLKITYGQQKAIILDVEQFVKDVREAALKFLEIWDKEAELQKQPKLKLTELRESLKAKA